MKSLSRRLLFSSFAAALLCCSIGVPKRLTAAERVMMGTPSHGLFEFPAVIAMKKGFYADEGLDLRKVQMQPAIGVPPGPSSHE